jgi:hypothetical protein
MIDTIENSAFAEWVRSSPSLFAYTSILSLHAMGLALIVGVNTVMALRLLGYAPALSAPALRQMYPWMYVGFTVNALSGVALLAANLRGDLENVMFIVKMAFIVLAMVNLELTRARVFDRPGVLESADLVRFARPFAIASLVLWGLAIVSGRLTAYPGLVRILFGEG